MTTREYALDPDQTPSEGVVRAVAETEGVASTAVEPPLYEAVDPEALDDLVETGEGRRVAVQFRYAGYEVSVDGGDGGLVHLVDGSDDRRH